MTELATEQNTPTVESGPSHQPAAGETNGTERGPPASVDHVLAQMEARVTELETVVHAIAPYSRNAEHGAVQGWLLKVGARLKELL